MQRSSDLPIIFFFFHTAFLVCCLSVLTTYGIHFIANMEPWSIGLLAVLVASFIVTVLLIQRQPQSQQKVAFMVNNFMLLFNERFGWIWTSGSGAERERWSFFRHSFVTALPLLQGFWWREVQQMLTAASLACAFQFRSSQDSRKGFIAHRLNVWHALGARLQKMAVPLMVWAAAITTSGSGNIDLGILLVASTKYTSLTPM